MTRRALLATLAVAGTSAATVVGAALPASAATPTDRLASQNQQHAVFLQSNDASGNSIGVFSRGRDGRLQAVADYPTGGNGASLPGAAVDPLASQGALTYDGEHHLLYAVNAGSNTLTVFRVEGLRLTRLQVLNTRGRLPVSVAEGGDTVVVLDASGDGAITTFKVVGGRLERVEGSTRSLGLGNDPLPNFLTAPAQVAVTPDGATAIVATKKHNTLISFRLNHHGVPTGRVVTPSAAPVPFALAFDGAGRLLVTEASGGESSYKVNPDGTLSVIASHVLNHQAAACWSVVARGFVYVANAGSASVTGYTEDSAGGLALHDASGVTAITGAGPVDLAATPDGQYLYQLANGAGEIDEFHVNADGSLSSVGTVAGLGIVNGAGAEGIAAS